MASSPDYAALLTPLYVSLVVEILELSLILPQTFRYFSRCRKDSLLLRIGALFALSVALFQTCMDIWNAWRVFAQNYGSQEAVLAVPWSSRIQPLLTINMATPLQLYLIHRIREFMKLKLYMIAPLAFLLVVAYASGLADSIQLIKYNFILDSNAPKRKDTTEPTFLLWVISSAVFDWAATVTLMVHLLRLKSQVAFPRFGMILGRLVNLAWETALPPALIAIVVAILHFASFAPGKQATLLFWDITFVTILGKVYVLSLFIMLNFRFDLVDEQRQRELEQGAPGTTRSHPIDRHQIQFKSHTMKGDSTTILRQSRESITSRSLQTKSITDAV